MSYIIPYSINDMKEARIVRMKEPLEVQTHVAPKPRGSEVLIKVQATGAYHDDIHLRDGKTVGRGNNQP